MDRTGAAALTERDARATLTDDARAAQTARDEFEAWLRGPASYLAAVARHELPVGETLRLHSHVIEALSDGFRVDGELGGPRFAGSTRTTSACPPTRIAPLRG
ncbi:MAG: hypothetical protein ACRDF9_04305 [Candidatus Limnocylindria bacterium]